MEDNKKRTLLRTIYQVTSGPQQEILFQGGIGMAPKKHNEAPRCFKEAEEIPSN